MLFGFLLTGLEQDYATWRRAFWKTVENGLKRDQTSKKHKVCESSVDGNCCCKTDKDQENSAQVLNNNFTFYISYVV